MTFDLLTCVHSQSMLHVRSSSPGHICHTRPAACSFSHYCATLMEGRKKEKSQKIDDLPVLVTCRSGALAMLMLSSKVNGPVTHKNTQ